MAISQGAIMDNQKLELTPDQIQNGMYTGDKQKDLQMVNDLLSGNVAIKHEQPAVEQLVAPIAPTDQVKNVTTDPDQVKNPEDVQPDITAIIDPIQEELDRERKYKSFLEQQRKDEHEKYLLDLKMREEELNREKSAREQLEQKVRQLSELQKQQPPSTDSTVTQSEEDDYVSDYTKRTRQMVEELRAQVGADNPVVKHLSDEISTIKQKYESERLERENFKKLQAEQEARKKTFNTIREFQHSCGDLQTSRDIEEIEGDYIQFRKDVAQVTRSKSAYDLDKAIMDYFGGGQTKQLIEQNGIKPPAEYDKFQMIVELNDMKHGIKYDPVTGKEIPILNDEGEQVKYGSLEEAYRVRNYHEEISKARRQSSIEIAKKLDEVKHSAVALRDDQMSQFPTGLTPDQKLEIFNWNPKDYMNDPEKLELVKMAYAQEGLEMPRYRGR